jgi:RsiW-degrading membrane proteinase PrsW (M82 family)
LSYKSINFDEKYDMLVYATCVALGFAGFENVIYGLTSTYEIAILRAFTAVPFHVCLGIIMGSNLLLAKISRLNKDKKREIKYIIFSILIPVLVHGSYDYILMRGNIYFIFVLFILLIILFVYIIKKINKISTQKQTLLKK